MQNTHFSLTGPLDVSRGGHVDILATLVWINIPHSATLGAQKKG